MRSENRSARKSLILLGSAARDFSRQPSQALDLQALAALATAAINKVIHKNGYPNAFPSGIKHLPGFSREGLKRGA
jgi:hypothetical protein